MTNPSRPNDFAERLHRIEERRQNQPPVTAADLGITPAPSPYDHPQERHLIRNTLIWMMIFAAAGLGGYHAINALPDDLKSLFGAGNGAENVASAAIDDTEEPVLHISGDMSDHGPILHSPHVANLQSEPLTLSDIASGVDLPTADTVPGAVIPFVRNASCSLRRPLPNETVMNIRLANGLLPAPVQAFSHAALADRLTKNVTAITQGGRAYDLDGRITGDLRSVDVFVTDTSAPLYLVLQNMGHGILWNIHTAPDVNVAHIAIVSSGHSGLVNLPANTTFDALLVSDFVGPHEFGADDQIRDCMIRPWRNPQPDWIAAQKAANGNTLYENQITSFSKGHAAYNAWYTSALGVAANTNIVAPRDAAHVLLGPVPATPITYRTIAGQNVHMMHTDNIITGNATMRAAQTEALHRDMLLAAIGGDIALLDPLPMERTSP